MSRKRPALFTLDAPPSGQCVREARTKYDLTAEAAAELVHATANAWWKWEAGTRQMDLARWELFLLKVGERRP